MSSSQEPTGLLSVPAFDAALERQAAVARRYGRPGALIRFAAGEADDSGMRAAGEVLRRRLRDTDLLARCGSGEFVVLLPESSAPAALALAVELVPLVAEAAGAPAAAGVVGFAEGRARSAAELLAEAGGALAAARGATPPVKLLEARAPGPDPASASSPQALRTALTSGELQLERRRVTDLRSGALDHRVLHARLPGAAEPQLDRAARLNLDRQIDRLVLEYALAAAGKPIVVPLTAGGAVDRELADWLVEALADRDPQAARLVVAVPESAALSNLPAVRSFAARLGEYGAGLALDDFGRAGALSLLKALPVAQVRLSAPLIRGLPSSDRDRAVVLALVHAAEALGAVTVATGVQGPEQLTAVRGFGIDLLEGEPQVI